MSETSVLHQWGNRLSSLSIRLKLIFYSSLLLLTLTVSLTLGASFITQEQTFRQNEERLITSVVSFQRELRRMFERDQRVVDDFFSRRKLTEWFRGQALINYSVEEIPEAIGEMGVALKSDKLAFYYGLEGSEALQLSQYYDRTLAGTVLIDYVNGKTQHLYAKNKDGQILSQKLSPQNSLPFPIEFSEFPQTPSIMLASETILWNVVFSFISKFNISTYGLKEGDILGKFVLSKPIEINLDEIGNDLGVHFNLYTSDGKMGQGIVPFADLDLQSTLFSGTEVTSLQDTQGNQYDALISPIYYGDQVIGYLSASIPQTVTTQKVTETINFLLFIALSVFVAVFVWSWILFIRFTTPIRELTRASIAIAKGNLDQDIQVYGHDELGTLARSFIRMRESIRNQIHLTEEKSLEIAKERNMLRNIIDTIPDLIYVKNRKHEFEVANYPITVSLNCTDRYQVLGKSNAEIYPTDRVEAITNAEAQVMETRTPLLNVEEPMVISGRKLWMLSTKIPWIDSRGEVVGVIGVSRDITEKVQAEAALKQYSAELKQKNELIEERNRKLNEQIELTEQKNVELQEMDRMKDEFLANTSHELRTPLHGIVGLAEAMIAQASFSEHEHHQLSMMAASGRRLSSLINDLLDFYKMKEHGIRLQKKPLLIQNLADSIITFSKPLVGDRPIILSNDIPQDFPALCADESRLEQILYNLVNNAIKFTEKGTVRITAQQIDETARISVEDSGIGIPDDQQSNIFDIFTQVDGSVSRERLGTGLGLSITKKLIELHGGTLEVQSQLDRGSCFSFTMAITSAPIESENNTISGSLLKDLQDRFFDQIPQIESQEPVLPTAAKADQKTILAIDDEAVNLEILRAIITGAGHHFISATGGEEALACLQKGVPDLILLDLMMPRMSGYELCRLVRTRWGLLSLPIVILSAKNQLSDLEEGFDAGANDYLTKPFHAKEILARVRTHLLAKDAYVQLRENQRLKEEIQERKRLEADLQTSQKQLAGILDSEENGVICLNAQGKIVFSNKAMEALMAIDAQRLQEMQMPQIFPQLAQQVDFQKWLGNPEKQVIQTEMMPHQGMQKTVSLYVSSMTIDNEDFVILICSAVGNSSKTINSGETEKWSAQPETLEAINHVDQRLFALENVIRGMMVSSPGGIYPSEPPLLNQYQTPTEHDFRHAIIDVMTLSLNYWELSTQKSKIELAEESQIWHVNVEDGTYKTRTLNRYLKEKSLPKNPRIQEVIRTAHYVLENCPGLGSKKTILEQAVQKLQLIHRNYSEA